MMPKHSDNGRFNLLITSRDLFSEGGVVSVVSMLIRNFSDNIRATHFQIGSRVNTQTWLLKPIYPIYDCIRLVSTVTKNSFGAVCLNTSFSKTTLLRDGLFLICLSLIGFKDTIVYFHGWDTDLSRQIERSVFLRRCFRRLFLRAKKIIVLASSFKNALIRMGIAADMVHVVTTMFDAESFNSIEIKDTSSDEITLIFLSRFQKEKGAFETIEAFSLLSKLYPKMNLVMAGDGPEIESLKRLVEKLDISERVHFTGYLRNRKKVEALSCSDIFVFPTYYREGCPVSLLEAMASGLAVVTTTVGAIPDIVENNVNGILLKDRNPSTIAGAIESLITDIDVLSQMKEKNRRKAFNKFEAKAVTMNIETILTS